MYVLGCVCFCFFLRKKKKIKLPASYPFRRCPNNVSSRERGGSGICKSANSPTTPLRAPHNLGDCSQWVHIHCVSIQSPPHHEALSSLRLRGEKKEKALFFFLRREQANSTQLLKDDRSTLFRRTVLLSSSTPLSRGANEGVALLTIRN